MPIPLGIMLGMQAAGMVVDYMGRENQIDLARQGEALEQQNINEQIQASRLKYEDASLQSMRQLRMNLGTQMASQAARGIRLGAGNSALVSNESIGNFNADQRMRRINQLSEESALKTSGMVSSLHEKAYESKNRNEFVNSAINKIPTTDSAWDKLAKSAKSGFGFTKVGA